MSKVIVTFICIFFSIISCGLFAKNIEQVTNSYISKGNITNLVSDKLKRNVLSNIGTSSVNNTHQLIPLTYQNAIVWAGDKEGLAAALSSEVSLLEEHIESVLNVNSYNELQNNEVENVCTERLDDSLNFKPIVVNYHNNQGAQEEHTLVVSNNGFLQMYKTLDNTHEEVWAFIPNELFHIIPSLKESNINTNEIYGIDGSGNVHIHDVNSDGIINTNDGDQAWLYFGLGRGGKSYYAIDISNPDKPELMWHIHHNTLGFSELAQTWGKVNIGFSKVNVTSNGQAKPVAFFSAGYDANKDSLTTNTNDGIGRGFYIVDAQTGTLLFSATPATTSHNNLKWLNITDSIASSLALMDSNSDGFIDRIYVGDTGANVWRIDMPSAKPFDQLSPWTIHKFAQLSANASTHSSVSNAIKKDELRFFNEPTIARAIMPYTVELPESISYEKQSLTTTVNKPYDVILLGSGNKASLLSTQTNNKFFLLKDANINTQSFNYGIAATTPKVITIADLHDVTKSIDTSSFTLQSQKTLSMNQSSGWLIDYENKGEKNISSGLVLSGVVYFNTFTPLSDHDLCEGVTRLYAIDLFNPSITYNMQSAEVEFFLPDTPEVIPLEQTSEVNSEDVLLMDASVDSNLNNDNFNSNLNNNEHTLVNNTLAVCDITGCINTLPVPEISPTNSSSVEANITEPLGSKPITLKTMRTSLYIQEIQ